MEKPEHEIKSFFQKPCVKSLHQEPQSDIDLWQSVYKAAELEILRLQGEREEVFELRAERSNVREGAIITGRNEEQAFVLPASAKTNVVHQLSSKLIEMRRENRRLLNEISCLKQVVQDLQIEKEEYLREMKKAKGDCSYASDPYKYSGNEMIELQDHVDKCEREIFHLRRVLQQKLGCKQAFESDELTATNVQAAAPSEAIDTGATYAPDSEMEWPSARAQRQSGPTISEFRFSPAARRSLRPASVLFMPESSCSDHDLYDPVRYPACAKLLEIIRAHYGKSNLGSEKKPTLTGARARASHDHPLPEKTGFSAPCFATVPDLKYLELQKSPILARAGLHRYPLNEKPDEKSVTAANRSPAFTVASKSSREAEESRLKGSSPPSSHVFLQHVAPSQQIHSQIFVPKNLIASACSGREHMPVVWPDGGLRKRAASMDRKDQRRAPTCTDGDPFRKRRKHFS